MSLIPDDLKRQTFPCPFCRHIISTDDRVCRFCEKEIDEQLQISAVKKELREQSRARLRKHKIYVGVGCLFFFAGIGSLMMTLLELKLGQRMVNFSCWTPILLIGGIGVSVMGFRGILREKQYLKNV